VLQSRALRQLVHPYERGWDWHFRLDKQRSIYVARHGRSQLRTGAGTRATDDAPLLLDKLTVESAAMLAGENEEAFEELLRLNGSPRTPGPKLWRESARQEKDRPRQQVLQPGCAHWMIKFPYSKDAAGRRAIEYAHSLMREMRAWRCLRGILSAPVRDSR
jgi:serine/threonine-protein kinase HipA